MKDSDEDECVEGENERENEEESARQLKSFAEILGEEFVPFENELDASLNQMDEVCDMFSFFIFHFLFF